MIVGVAGMTHLGLVSSAAFCAKGFETLCFDPDAGLICRLASGDLPIQEPGLVELIADNDRRHQYSADPADLARCDVVFIALDIVTDDLGHSDLAAVLKLIDTVSQHLAASAVLVILCQVPPGFTRSLNVNSPHVYYQVETLVFGRSVERAMQPERCIVGCADPARPLPKAYRSLLEAFECPILLMGYESAELAKIAINLCLATSISVANTMAELCEEIGAVWPEIVPALKLDRRIGAYSYLDAGLGIAGGNIERDLATIISLAGERGTDAGLVKACVANSRHRRDWAVRTLRKHVLAKNGDPLVAVWGLAYKQDTQSIKNSPSLATLAQLPEVRVRLHDPVVPAEMAGHPRFEAVTSYLAALEGADALMILTPWAQYRDASPAKIAAAMAGRVVLDPYRVLDAEAARAAGLDYFTLGMPPLTAA